MLHNGKAKIEKVIGGVNIIVPSKKNWFRLIFLSVWGVGWVLGLVMFFSMAFFDTAQVGKEVSMISSFIIWLGFGFAAITILLWGYFGKEKFITNGNDVLLEKTVFNIGIKRKLKKYELKNFRTSFTKGLFSRIDPWVGFGPGKIKFDYGFRTYSFAAGIDDEEATYLVELLKETFASKSTRVSK